MALIGKNRHYHWDKLHARHFISTAQHVGYSTEKAHDLLVEMKQKTDDFINKVTKIIPENFPLHIANSILDGLWNQAKKIPY